MRLHIRTKIFTFKVTFEEFFIAVSSDCLNFEKHYQEILIGQTSIIKTTFFSLVSFQLFQNSNKTNYIAKQFGI